MNPRQPYILLQGSDLAFFIPLKEPSVAPPPTKSPRFQENSSRYVKKQYHFLSLIYLRGPQPRIIKNIQHKLISYIQPILKLFTAEPYYFTVHSNCNLIRPLPYKILVR